MAFAGATGAPSDHCSPPRSQVSASHGYLTLTCSPHVFPGFPHRSSQIARILDEDFKTAKDAQAKMDSSAYTPCIIGPGRDGPRFFIVDDHHTLCALDFSGFKDTTLILNVSCDLRSLTRAQFSEYLRAHAFVYLASPPNHNPLQLPAPIPFEQLPQTIHFTRSDGVFLNDPWRSLVGFARKVAVAPSPFPACAASDYKYCMRCMVRGCGSDGLQKSGQAVAFFEFKWS